MRVIGVDPGLTRAGYAVVEQSGSRLASLEHGTIRGDAAKTPPEQLADLRARLSDAIDRLEPAAMAIERVFFNKNVRTAARTMQASGVAQCLAAERGLAVYEYGPLEVKNAIVGVGNATKDQVQFMVRRIVGVEIGEPDAADAVALAVCALHARPWAAAALSRKAMQ